MSSLFSFCYQLQVAGFPVPPTFPPLVGRGIISLYAYPNVPDG